MCVCMRKRMTKTDMKTELIYSIQNITYLTIYPICTYNYHQKYAISYSNADQLLGF